MKILVLSILLFFANTSIYAQKIEGNLTYSLKEFPQTDDHIPDTGAKIYITKYDSIIYAYIDTFLSSNSYLYWSIYHRWLHDLNIHFKDLQDKLSYYQKCDTCGKDGQSRSREDQVLQLLLDQCRNDSLAIERTLNICRAKGFDDQEQLDKITLTFNLVIQKIINYQSTKKLTANYEGRYSKELLPGRYMVLYFSNGLKGRNGDLKINDISINTNETKKDTIFFKNTSIINTIDSDYLLSYFNDEANDHIQHKDINSGTLPEYHKTEKTVEDYFKDGNEKSENRDYFGAIADYNKAIKLDPGKGNIYYNRGGAKEGLEDYRGALADYDKCIKLNPGSSTYYASRGLLKSKMKDNAGAIKDLNKAIEINPDNADAYLYRGLTKVIIGQKNSGCLDLSKAGELGDAKAYDLIKEFCLPK